jgi:hypothetical protein
MQFSSPDNYNPKRIEKCMTNFYLLQKGYDFLRNRLRVPKCDIMFTVYKTLCHSVLHYFKQVCNAVQKANKTDITQKFAPMDKSTFSDSLSPHLCDNGNSDKRSTYRVGEQDARTPQP